jgi:hypothetical protein
MPEVSDAQPLARVRRSLLLRHYALSALLWITYALYWRVVLHRGVEREARIAAILLGLFVLLQFLMTQGWIAHSRRLARRHEQRRRERPGAKPPRTADFLGRSLRAHPETADLTRVPVVIVRVEGGEKRFEAGLSLPAERRDEP